MKAVTGAYLILTSSVSAVNGFTSQFGIPKGSFSALKMAQEIEVVSQPDKEFLEKKGVFGWGTWGCGVSKFPWSYDSSESCYLLSGQVTVTPSDGRKAATFGKGDFVTFPAGMSCEWDVKEAVQKHFMFF
mmetsp:Transcript_3787/g.4640  ORF Transcript_3787/g.4640 Transcript_3787/m.4640 type:complete len:130 (-) Transcript_3787:762-1151(-)